MSDTKQPNLNGAYYGPSIPPPNTYHRPGRGRGCGCCLLSLFFKILITIIILAGIAVLVFWLVFRPNRVKFHVTSAELSQFDLNSTTNNLRYNLSLDLSIRNPNKHIGIYYDRIEPRAFYQGQRFAFNTLTPFYQGHKNTTNLSLTFNSQNTVVVLDNSDLSDYNSDKTKGVYSIDVKLYLRVRFKLRGIKTHKFKPKIECDLKVPLDKANSGSGFQTTKCGFDW